MAHTTFSLLPDKIYSSLGYFFPTFLTCNNVRIFYVNPFIMIMKMRMTTNKNITIAMTNLTNFFLSFLHVTIIWTNPCQSVGHSHFQISILSNSERKSNLPEAYSLVVFSQIQAPVAASLPKTTNKIIVFKSVSPILEVLLAFASACIIVLVLPRKKANWLDMGLAQNIFQNLIYSNFYRAKSFCLHIQTLLGIWLLSI